MIFPRSWTACVGVVAVLLFSGVIAQADTPLRWTGKAGDKLKYTFTQATDIKVTPKGQPSPSNTSKNELTVDLTWTIKAVAADGTLEVTQVADRVRAKTTADGLITVYDSSDKAEPTSRDAMMLTKIYESMIGQSYTLKISPQGEILDVKIPDAVVAAVGATPFAGASADSGSFVSAAGLKITMAQVIPRMPKEAVATDARWKNDFTLPAGPLKILLTSHYAVSELSSTVKIQGKIDASITVDPNSPFKIKINKQAGSSKIAFDAAGGHQTDASIEQTLDMAVTSESRDFNQVCVLAWTMKLVP